MNYKRCITICGGRRVDVKDVASMCMKIKNMGDGIYGET